MRTKDDKQALIYNISNRDHKQYEQFLSALAEYFPNTAPSLQDEDRLIWFKAGQVSVVTFLKKLHKDAMETLLER